MSLCFQAGWNVSHSQSLESEVSGNIPSAYIFAWGDFETLTNHLVDSILAVSVALVSWFVFEVENKVLIAGTADILACQVLFGFLGVI
jgi:hypothetical protein